MSGNIDDRHRALLALVRIDRLTQVRAVGRILELVPDEQQATELARILFAPGAPQRVNGAPADRSHWAATKSPGPPLTEPVPEPPPCGSQEAYRRHLSLREDTDTACRAAHVEYVRSRPGGW